MLFNSQVFLLFFAAVYALYLVFRRRHDLQNLLLLIASYYFYGFWDWRFLSLLLISTVIDYAIGRRLESENAPRRRKLLLFASVAANLGILGFFKYFNFFTGNAIALLRALGMNPDAPTLKIILPVGISFYTFQTMSYTIDVYRRRMPATRDFPAFALYVSFFPQLVAGPIERAAHLLPQMLAPRKILPAQLHAGLYLILLGYFKKVVVADNLARIANAVFGAPALYNGLDTLLGVLAFAFQIYGDFSGYSDIARGLAKLLGFDLMINFKLPYFALSPSEFWRRWHVSLSTWLRDYLYIPLGGNRGGPAATYRNLMLTMLLGGLWHGATWMFVLWGFYQGLLLVAYRAIEPRLPAAPARGPLRLAITGARMALMFFLVLIGWIFFRAPGLPAALTMLRNLGLSPSNITAPMAYDVAYFILPLLLLDIYHERKGDLLAPTKWPYVPRIALYAALLAATLALGVRESVEFIYFQF